MQNTTAPDTAQSPEKIVLAGVTRKGASEPLDELMDELEELAKTAGAEVAGRLVQKLEHAHPGHYLGKGKADELKELALSLGAACVVTNDELTPAQTRNLSDMLDMKVIDRTALILDIFAMRAQSAEGKAQVEMAQLKYRLSRLTGAGRAMSRLGAGIGTRGPGETKLETDRRVIRDKLTRLRRELEEIRQRRGVVRKQRERVSVPVASFVGYTNAGKSTLMNRLSGAGVFVEDKLFATLDTTTRRILCDGAELLLTDTVGFIRMLPTDLVEAFKSTLEELLFSDILIHVVDASNPSFPAHMSAVYDTLHSLGADTKPIITVFNKIDKLQPEGPSSPLNDPRAVVRVLVSAATGEGIDELMAAISGTLASLKKNLRILLPFSDGHMLDYAHKTCVIHNIEHSENGTLINLSADGEAAQKLAKYAL